VIAAKAFDPVTGVDVHIIQPPGPVPPVPVPHPFVGMLVDPMDFAPVIGSTVMVNGMPRATAGTGGQCIPPHIPIGGTFIKPPANECEVFMGSSTVIADGDPLSFLGMPVLSCHDVGMPPPPRPKKKRKTKSLVLPTSVVLPVPAGAPVLVGGPPTVSMMALGMKAGMAAVGTAFRRLRSVQRGSRRMRAVSDRVHRSTRRAMDRLGVPPSAQNRVHRAICTATGHPVDVATGKVFTESVDVELPGPLPFVLERVWYSTSTYEGPFGHGWHHRYDLGLAVEDGVAVVRLPDGRCASFAPPEPGAPSWNAGERMWLRIEEGRHILEEEASGLRYHFGASRAGSGLATPPPWLSVEEVEDRNGNRLRFGYDASGALVAVEDSAGRRIDLRCDDRGRIVQVLGPRPGRPGQQMILASYRYDEAGHLVEASDGLGNPIRYRYDDQRRLVQETDRFGLSFHFEYEGEGPSSRCTRTWGDGGVYERHLRYDTVLRTTTVTDTRGGETLYGWNDLGLVEREVDPHGGERLTEFDEHGRRLSTTDPLGATTSWSYDDRGRVLSVTDPLGHVRRITYDPGGNAVELTDEGGSTWRRQHDSAGNVVAVTDPEGGTTRYRVDPRGLPVSLVDPLGHEMELEWDAAGNLVQVVDRAGATTELRYDALGRLTSRTDAEGGETRFERDPLGRITTAEDPSGRRTRFRYDEAGNVVETTDPLGRTRLFGFEPVGPGGMLSRVTEPSGATTRYRYDGEGDLVEVEDPTGRRWRFARDATGRVLAEEDFAGRRLRYVRDSAGGLTGVLDGLGRETLLERDPVGRLVRRRYGDGEEETFAYDPAGRLSAAVNGAAEVRFVRDRCGRVMEEHQNGEVVRSRYDAAGNRLRHGLPSGRELLFGYDPEGRTTRVATDDGVLLESVRDRLGRETERRLPSGVTSRRSYTATSERSAQSLGRPGSRPLLERRYEYDAGSRVTSVSDSRFGVLRYEHDPDGFLASVVSPEGEVEHFRHDAAGNVPAAPVRLGREVAGAGRASGAGALPPPAAEVRHAAGWTLAWDPDGNLVSKENASTRFRFHYDAAGRLVRAERDGVEVARYAYDALGRRVEKRTAAGRASYVWDGDVLAEERVGPTAPGSGGDGDDGVLRVRGYVFDGFDPVAVLDADEPLFLETDPVGLPHLAVSDRGEKVWEARYGGFGTVRTEDTARGRAPVELRYAGQLADPETGLSYNRFRYYDATTRAYLTPDPLGLNGIVQTHNYVPDPGTWVDPYGLDVCYDTRARRFRDTDTGRFVAGTREPGRRFPRNTTPGERVRYRVNGGTGDVNHYAVYDANGRMTKRIDFEGPPHTNPDGTVVPTPHAHPQVHNTAPNGYVGVGDSPSARPITADDRL
jgi:RHS repeat-associated protein